MSHRRPIAWCRTTSNLANSRQQKARHGTTSSIRGSIGLLLNRSLSAAVSATVCSPLLFWPAQCALAAQPASARSIVHDLSIPTQPLFRGAQGVLRRGERTNCCFRRTGGGPAKCAGHGCIYHRASVGSAARWFGFAGRSDPFGGVADSRSGEDRQVRQAAGEAVENLGARCRRRTEHARVFRVVATRGGGSICSRGNHRHRHQARGAHSRYAAIDHGISPTTECASKGRPSSPISCRQRPASASSIRKRAHRASRSAASIRRLATHLSAITWMSFPSASSPQPVVPDVRTFDLERVEVLRGPRGHAVRRRFSRWHDSRADGRAQFEQAPERRRPHGDIHRQGR